MLLHKFIVILKNSEGTYWGNFAQVREHHHGDRNSSSSSDNSACGSHRRYCRFLACKILHAITSIQIMIQDFTIIFPTPNRHHNIHFQISECFMACKILHAITSTQIMNQDFTIIFTTPKRHQSIHFQILECFLACKILHAITSTAHKIK